jgi:glycosyltransferase involved in cell wall biosynthesis
MTAPVLLPAPESHTHIPDGFSGMKIVEVELCQPLPAVSFDGKHQRLWVLARLHSEPIGTCTVDLGSSELSPQRFGEILWRELSDVITERFAASRVRAPHALTASGLDVAPESWPFLRARLAALEAPPFISVIVCTYNRPDQLAVCLDHLERQQYPSFEVIVVDNSPQTRAVRAQVRALDPARFRYVPEPRAGLSRARNAGVSVAKGDILAFVDDDEEPDVCWLAALAGGFARGSDVGCVTGLIAPARLDTGAQVAFEEIGGHSKGRGFEPAIFTARGPQSPLYPRPPFGAGGNMAFRREVLARIGRFDNALGAGTRSLGAEDTLALTLVLLSGFAIAYEPAALVRHHHYRDFSDAAAQLRGYAVGTGAFYLALAWRRPWVLWGLARLAPDAVRYLRASRLRTRRSAFPLSAELTSGLGLQIFAGPLAYLRAVGRNAASSELRSWGIGARRRGRHRARRRTWLPTRERPSGPSVVHQRPRS